MAKGLFGLALALFFLTLRLGACFEYETGEYSWWVGAKADVL